jgi:hypothetical protein
MPDPSLSVAVSVAVGGLLTPLIVRWWSRAAPPAETSEFDSLGLDGLRERNNRIDVIASILSFCGLLTAFPFYIGPAKWNSGWPLGMGFGFMVIFPVIYIWLATRHGGVSRWHEFWRFYELKWGIGLRGLRWFYVPVAGLGIVSLVMVLIGI